MFNVVEIEKKWFCLHTSDVSGSPEPKFEKPKQNCYLSMQVKTLQAVFLSFFVKNLHTDSLSITIQIQGPHGEGSQGLFNAVHLWDL